MHPFLRRYKHISVEPCEGKILSVPVIDGPPRSSDTFVGRSLVHFSPNNPPGFYYRFRGSIKARNLQKRFNELMLSYNNQLLDFANFIHQPSCLTSFCTVCDKIDFITRLGLDYSGPEKYRLKHTSRLAIEFEWLLTECILVLRQCFPDQSFRALPCPAYWSLDTEAWVKSINGLLEIGNILLEAGFEKCKRIWDVIDAHLTFTCPDLKVAEDLTKRWFREETWKERTKAMEDLKNGNYENLFVYTLCTDYQKSLKKVRFQLEV